MNRFKQFIVPFAGLSLGDHRYEFEIGDWFFEQFEYSEIKKANVKVVATLKKTSTMLAFDFQETGEIEVCCDRCAEDFYLPVDGEHRLIIKFGPEAREESDEIIVLPSGDHEIDLSQYIYEYLILDLPIQRVHGTDAEGNSLCDPEVIEKLNQIATENKKEEGNDPRWDALKNLN
jgi:uncharacterized metal-binding protein YceD (DUF177 family)